MGIIKQLAVIIALAMLAGSAFATDYYFLVKTNNKGDGKDPVKTFYRKYYNPANRIFYGQGLSVVLISATVEPNDSSAVKVTNIDTLSRPSLEGFNAVNFKKGSKDKDKSK